MPADWLVLLSAAALAFAVLCYIVLDGTDLGVGMLFACNPQPEHRHVMAFSILPIWDGNETWLVLGGGGLLALFPVAYGLLLPALYLPLVLMFLALVVRAVALEYRDRAETPRRQRLFDLALFAGSLLASLSQGSVLGVLVQGVPQLNGHYRGQGWEWLSPFALYCGLALAVGYLWLGACWLYWRSEGDLHQRARRQALWFGAATVLLLAGVLTWTLLQDLRYAQRLARPEVAGSLATSALLLTALFVLSFRTRRHYLPLFLALGLFVQAYAALILALYPLIVPPHLTLTAAASPPASQGFMLAGFAVLVPFTLAYSSYGFWIFRGKIRPRR